ncbi:MAG TPA: hypothetical protein VGF69_14800, partial [Thermoanaerobaculia bacterium]
MSIPSRVPTWPRLLVVALILLVSTTATAWAQSCPPPVIVQIGGSNPSCAGQAVTLDAGDGYAGYLWSNGATTRIITDTPPADTTYTVTVTDANGCSVTSPPLTVDVHGAVPAIDGATEVCPGSTGYAWLTQYYVSHVWTISGGTLTSNATDSTANFQASAGSSQVVLTVTVTDEDGCTMTNSRTVQVGAVESLPIQADSTACPGGVQTAVAYAYPGATSYLWSISGGRFIGPVNGTTVQYVADLSGTVHLEVSAETGTGCSGHGVKDLPIQGVPIEIMYSEKACPGQLNWLAASGVPYDARWEWTVANGQIVGPTHQSAIQYIPTGGGPVVATVKYSTPNNGCVTTKTVTVPVEPELHPQLTASVPSMCPNGMATVTIADASSWDGVYWYTNAPNGSAAFPGYLNIYSGGPGEILVRVEAWKNGCSFKSSLTIPVAVPSAAISMPSAVCGNSTFIARAADAGAGAAYVWNVTGGTLVSSNGNTATIAVPASGSLSVGVSVTNASGCSASASATATIGTTLAPTVLFNNACNADPTIATIGDAENYTSIAWSITGGSIDGPINGPSVVYTTASATPAQLTATVTNAAGCSGSVTVAAPAGRAVPLPVLAFNGPVCGVGGTQSVQITNASLVNPQWTLTNAVVDPYQYSPDAISFVVTGNGPVTATVTGLSDGCPVSASATAVLEPPAPLTISPSVTTLCGFNAAASATVAPYDLGTGSLYWSIENGVIDGSASGLTVNFRGFNNPVRLKVTRGGCDTPATIEIPLAEGPKITVDVASICPYDGVGRASVSGSFPGLEWLVTNGEIVTNEGNAITFRATSGNSPVTVYASLMNGGGGCTPSDSVTVPIRTISQPSITVDKASICPYDGTATATVSGTWATIEWFVSNGTMVSQSGNSMTFRSATAAYPVYVYANVQDAGGCRTWQQSTIPIRVIEQPTITADKASICPYDGTATATVSGTWSTIEWYVSNGTMVSQSGNSMTFRSSTSSEPVYVYANVQDAEGCRTWQQFTMPIRVIAPPVITADQASVCPNAGTATATVSGTWASIQWSVSNGTMLSQNGNSVTVRSTSSSEPVAISVSVQDTEGCRAIQSLTIPLSVTEPPVLTSNHESICANSGTATVTVQGTWSLVSFPDTIPNAEIVSENGNSITIRSTSTEAVTVPVMVQTADGCFASGSITIPVQVVTAPAITADGPLSICAGGSVTLTSTAADSYLWSNGATTQSIVVTEPGTFTVTATVNGCSAGSAPLQVTAGGGGSVTITAPDQACRSTTQSASAPFYPMATYQWTISGGTWTGGTAPAGPSVSFVANSSGSAVVLGVTITKAGESCAYTGSATVPLVGPPPASLLNPTAEVCETGTFTLTAVDAGPGAVYEWSFGRAQVVSGQGTRTVTGTVTSPGPYVQVTLKVTRAGCSTTGTTDVHIERLGSLTTSGSTTFCEGGSVTLNAPSCGGCTYSWSTGATTRSIVVTTGGNYSVTSTSPSGCTKTASRVVTVNTPPPTPAITAGGPTTFCEGGSVTLTAPGGYTYLWSNGATTQSINATQSGSYTVTVTSNGCSATSAPIAVTVNPKPAGSISPAGPLAICAYNYVTLTAPEATSYLWSNGATTRSINVASSMAGNYSVTVTNASGCSTTTAPVAVTAGADVPQPTLTGYGKVCPNTTNVITIDDPSYVSFQWSIAGGTINGSTTGRAVSYTAPASGTVELQCIVTHTSGCVRTSSFTVQVAVPDATFTLPSNLCPGSDYGISMPQWGPGATYSWTVSGPATFTPTGGDYGNQGMLHLTGEAGTLTMTGTVVTPTGCSATYTSSTEIRPVAPFTIDTPDAVCNATGNTASVTAEGATSYFWSITGGTIVGSRTGSSVTYDVTAAQATLSAQVSNGTCTRSVSKSVANQSTPPVITYSRPTPQFCPGETITLTAPAGQASYLWSNGATTRSIVVDQTGTYTVTVTTTGGCSLTSAPLTVTMRDVPAPVLTVAPSPLCDQTQTFTTTVTNRSAFQIVHWQSATAALTAVSADGATATWLRNPGDDVWVEAVGYSLEGACPRTTHLDVADITAPNATIAGPTEICSALGFVQSAVPDGGPGVTYDWDVSNGTILAGELGRTLSWRPNPSNTNPTTLYVTVTDANGCARAGYLQVTKRPAPDATITMPASVCPGAIVTASVPDVPGLTYAWNMTGVEIISGGTSPTITFRAPAFDGATFTASITIYAPGGCQNSDTETGVTTTAPAATIAASGSTALCPGSSVTLTASAASSYLWSNGATTRDITVTDPGNYTVTVTGANGCAATSAATNVTTQPAPTATITAGGPTSFCPGGSVTLTANSGTSYLWSNGATTQSITVTTGGNYTVAVTSPYGCTATSAVTTVTILPKPVIGSTRRPPAVCPNGIATADVQQNAAWTYQWSAVNGVIEQGQGTYFVTFRANANATGNVTLTCVVTNASGCTDTATLVVPIHSPEATITAGGATTFCVGGSVTLTAPAGYNNYLWSNGATTPSINVTTGGTYWVQVSTGYCSDRSDNLVVTVDPLPSTAITASSTAICAGSSATLTAPAGTGYSYLWSTGATTRSISVTEAGDYSVTVSTPAGCSATSAPTSITVNATPVATITANGPTTFCPGGSVTLTANNAASYLWSNGATTQSINVSSAGNYSVTITDANGCTATSAATSVTVNAAPAATITASGPAAFCAGGSVTLTANSAASYLWSNGATTQSINVSSNGNYSVTITDANGCSATSAATAVTVHATPSATITANGPTTFCAGGSVILTANNAASYLWSNGATTQSINVTDAGNYSVTITDANGCSATSAVTAVSVNPIPYVGLSVDYSACPGVPRDANATLVMDGAYLPNAPFVWSIEGGTLSATTGAHVTFVASQPNSTVTLTLTGTDSRGCSKTVTKTVEVGAGVVPTITANGPTTFCAGNSVELIAPDMQFGSYEWSTGATGRVLLVTQPGTYTVTYYEGVNGCGATSEPVVVTVNTPAVPAVTADGPLTFCEGGSVTLTASEGASYLWSTGATTRSITVTGSVYNGFVAVTDANGCEATSAPFDVIVPGAPAATITAGGPTTFCAGGTVRLTASSGTSYLWSTGATSQFIDVTASGNYSVTVTNGNGCSKQSAPAAVTVTPLPDATITGTTSICAGTTTTLTAPSGTGYSYLWSTGATSQSISVGAGNYSVTVTANGCSTQSAVTT